MARQTSSQTVGPYFAYGLTPGELTGINYAGFTGNCLASPETQGEHVAIHGRVIDGEGAPVSDAMLEIWQANAAGRYRHSEDERDDVALDETFHGFGRTGTDRNGQYWFHTIKPGPVPGRGNALQAPHVVLCVFARGMLSHAYTRVYFSDEVGPNDSDPVLNSVEDVRRPTLVAERSRSGGQIAYRFDIHLQGDRETVFFDV